MPAAPAICVSSRPGGVAEEEEQDGGDSWPSLPSSSSPSSSSSSSSSPSGTTECLPLPSHETLTLKPENPGIHGMHSLLPHPFLQYLERSGIDPAMYSAILPRYVRFKQGFESERSPFESELGIKLHPVPWLQGFFSMPCEVHIAGSQAYKQGKIFGMDAASGAAVAALGVLPEDHVLDLCAAPGAKLCMIAELVGDTGTVTGVDISRHRLAACRTMLLKYGVENCCRLFVADGTEFTLLPIRHSGNETVKQIREDSGRILRDCKSAVQEDKHSKSFAIFVECASRRTRREKQAAQKALQELKTNPLKNKRPELLFYGRKSGVVGKTEFELFANSCNEGLPASEFGYDKVLVDAECTHDGSLKHIAKYERWGWDTLEHQVLDRERLVSISQLQLQLLTSGFKLLKVGGTLVYSTCSFTTMQNEEIVEKFLSKFSNAALKEIEVASQQDWPCKCGKVMHSLRFDPLTSRTGGLFIVKIIKEE